MVGTDECFIPLEVHLDKDKEIDEISREIAYTEGFLKTVEKKLSNERFVNNAPEKVVAIEQKKRNDAEHKLKALKEKLEHYKK
jgi:valyl-tRNA synthetase